MLLGALKFPSVPEAFALSARIWVAWSILWLLMAAWTKPSKRSEFAWQRLEHALPLVFGFLLIYNESFAWKWLGARLVPENSAVAAIGLALTAGGLLFAVWARVALGGNWSGSVTIKSGHHLIRSGPYRRIRHPIYTGLLASLVGTVMLEGQVRALVAFLVALLALYFKARREEKFLSEEFGNEFAEHTRHTGMFLPRFS